MERPYKVTLCVCTPFLPTFNLACSNQVYYKSADLKGAKDSTNLMQILLRYRREVL